MALSASGESSFLLWLMAGVVAALSAYLFIGWVRRAQGLLGWRQLTGPMLLAGSALGLGMSCAMVLALSAEALSFPLGYRWLWVPLLLLAPMLACIPVAWALSRRQKWWVLLLCSLSLTAIAVAVQVGWILAAGLRPGLRWQFSLLGAAAAVAAVGFGASLWLAYSDASGNGARKTLWRVGAAVLMALTLIAGQELVGASVALSSQVGSIFQREASGTWMSLFAGAVVPVAMALLALDLALRNSDGRHRSRHGGIKLDLPKGRKRKSKRKYRAL